MRKFDTNFISHKETFMILFHAFFRRGARGEFHKSISQLELNSNDFSDFPKASLKVFLTRVFG